MISRDGVRILLNLIVLVLCKCLFLFQSSQSVEPGLFNFKGLCTRTKQHLSRPRYSRKVRAPPATSVLPLFFTSSFHKPEKITGPRPPPHVGPCMYYEPYHSTTASPYCGVSHRERGREKKPMGVRVYPSKKCLSPWRLKGAQGNRGKKSVEHEAVLGPVLVATELMW